MLRYKSLFICYLCEENDNSVSFSAILFDAYSTQVKNTFLTPREHCILYKIFFEYCFEIQNSTILAICASVFCLREIAKTRSSQIIVYYKAI